MTAGRERRRPTESPAADRPPPPHRSGRRARPAGVKPRAGHRHRRPLVVHDLQRTQDADLQRTPLRVSRGRPSVEGGNRYTGVAIPDQTTSTSHRAVGRPHRQVADEEADPERSVVPGRFGPIRRSGYPWSRCNGSPWTSRASSGSGSCAHPGFRSGCRVRKPLLQRDNSNGCVRPRAGHREQVADTYTRSRSGTRSTPRRTRSEVSPRGGEASEARRARGSAGGRHGPRRGAGIRDRAPSAGPLRRSPCG